jgi:ribose/xylose/arabinose/galactoside ABC-type transport system permease subunit
MSAAQQTPVAEQRESVPERRRPLADAKVHDLRLAQSSLTFVAFVAAFVAYSLWLGDKFLNADTRLLDVQSNVPVLLLGLSVVITLLAGQFDLSVGNMATLVAFLAVGLRINQNWPFPLVLVACLGIGLAGGLLNGLIVVKLKVNAFIATLGSGGLFVGLSSVYSGQQVVSPTTKGPQLPQWFTSQHGLGSFGEKAPSGLVWAILAAIALRAALLVLERSRRLGQSRASVAARLAAIVVLTVLAVVFLRSWVAAVSWLIFALFCVATIFWAVMRYTVFGRGLRATGSNASAARLAGIRTERTTVLAFVIGGLLASLGGLSLAALNGSASPGIAVPFLLPAFAAAFLSTVLFSHGQFTIWGTVTGGVFLVWVAQGLIVGGLAFTWTDVVNGVVLVCAVALSTMFRRST